MLQNFDILTLKCFEYRLGLCHKTFTMLNNTGEGKITYTFSANANVLSANFPFSVLPAGGGGGDGSGGGNGKYVGVSGKRIR